MIAVCSTPNINNNFGDSYPCNKPFWSILDNFLIKHSSHTVEMNAQILRLKDDVLRMYASQITSKFTSKDRSISDPEDHFLMT